MGASGPSGEVPSGTSGAAKGKPPSSSYKGSKTTAYKPSARKQGNKAAEFQDLSVEDLIRKLKGCGISDPVLCEKFNAVQ